MKDLILVFKGFIIGIAKIIPGVSGAIIAISFGVYERLVNIMSRPTKIRFNDLKFLVYLLLGAALGISLLCKGVKWCLDVYYLPTMLLFLGLIVGGISEITNEIKTNKISVKNFVIFLICFFLLYCLVNIQGDNNETIYNNFVYFLMGIIESATTIIPGISGTAIFMALGWYEVLLSIFEDITNFSINFSTLFFFLSGFVICTIMISKILTYLFNKHKHLAYTGVLGFMISSLVIMLNDTFAHSYTVAELIVGFVLFILGILMTKKINLFFSKL